jgi:hypothetical protein
MRLPLSVRYISLQVLLVYYPILSEHAELVPNLKAGSVLPELQCEIMRLLGTLIELTVVCPSSCTVNQFRTFQESLLQDISFAFSFVASGYFSVQYATPILKWMGFPSQTYLWKRHLSQFELSPDCGTVGDCLDSLCSEYLSSSMGEMIDIIKEDNGVDNARDYAEPLFVLLLDTLQNSMFMYITCQCPDISAPEKVFDAICVELKSWISHFKHTPNASAQNILATCLIRLMMRGMGYLVQCIGSWEKTSEEVRLVF